MLRVFGECVFVHRVCILSLNCYPSQRSADSLGEDELSEDLERLRASLEAERQDTLDRSAKLLPDQRYTHTHTCSVISVVVFLVTFQPHEYYRQTCV